MSYTSIDKVEEIKNDSGFLNATKTPNNVSTGVTQKSFLLSNETKSQHRIKVLLLQEKIQEIQQKILILRSDLNPNCNFGRLDANCSKEKWTRSFKDFRAQIEILQENYVHYNEILQDRNSELGQDIIVE